MGRRPRGTGAPASVGWLLVLGGLLGGLFAMHGLSDHSVPGRSMPAMTVGEAPLSSAAPMAGPVAGHRAAGMGPMAGTCLAFLALVLLVMVDRAGGRRTPRPGPVPGHRVRPAGVRERAPPTLELLSVRRC